MGSELQYLDSGIGRSVNFFHHSSSIYLRKRKESEWLVKTCPKMSSIGSDQKDGTSRSGGDKKPRGKVRVRNGEHGERSVLREANCRVGAV